jgi:aspartyl-tRNA(Asn)/glutamyl-tRNA(Gln) amidotransferase subunit A
VTAGAAIGDAEYAEARREAARLREAHAEVMTRVDVLAAPTNPVSAPRVGQERIALREGEYPIGEVMPRLGLPHNLTGCPALSLPCGFAASGVPVGLQLAGRAFEEATVLRVARAYERATPWHRCRPPAASWRTQP